MAQQGTAAAAAAAAASNGAAPAPASSSYYNYEDPADQLLPDQSTNLGAAGDEDDDEDYDSEDDEHAAAAGGQQTYGDFVAQGGMKQQQEGSDVEGGDGEDEEARLAEAEERKRELEEDVPEEVKRVSSPPPLFVSLEWVFFFRKGKNRVFRVRSSAEHVRRRSWNVGPRIIVSGDKPDTRRPLDWPPHAREKRRVPPFFFGTIHLWGTFGRPSRCFVKGLLIGVDFWTFLFSGMFKGCCSE